MSISASSSNTCNHTSPSSPCTAFIDPNLCTLRGFRAGHSFWSASFTDAMALRDEKFKAFNYSAPGNLAPRFEVHYEDHFTAASRLPRNPSVVTPVAQQPQSQPQKQTLEIEFLKWFIIIAALLFAMWCLGLAQSLFGSVVTLAVIGMVSLYIVAYVTDWLETEEEFEL